MLKFDNFIISFLPVSDKCFSRFNLEFVPNLCYKTNTLVAKAALDLKTLFVQGVGRKAKRGEKRDPRCFSTNIIGINAI